MLLDPRPIYTYIYSCDLSHALEKSMCGEIGEKDYFRWGKWGFYSFWQDANDKANRQQRPNGIW